MRKINALTLVFLLITIRTNAGEPEVPLYSIVEVDFTGPRCTTQDSPARDVDLYTKWQHQDSSTELGIYGYFDGDGAGGNSGNVFKVRFCPTIKGTWTLIKTLSNQKTLEGQNEGLKINCVDSTRHGFWMVDKTNAGSRWYQRSDGSHQYIVGNTLYTFLSGMDQDGPTGRTIDEEIVANAGYFNKVRFSINGGRYPHPTDKPFLDDNGKPTDDGNFSYRPNPAWFHNRVDLAVKTAATKDVIADIIINGPDTKMARSVLKAGANDGNPEPILRYLAARYGSFPNVWFCLANEWDIKNPKFTAQQIIQFGQTLKKYLPYHTPVSVHAAPTDWNKALNTSPPWNDHLTLQYKIKLMNVAADFIEKNYWIGGADKPVINDELAYQGRGDGWSEEDVLEAFLGVFAGGGYGSTGFKDPVTKQGHYFAGGFTVKEHTAADNLKWMRDQIEKEVTFWKMRPNLQPRFTRNSVRLGPFSNIDPGFRELEWKGHEYILATNKKWQNIKVKPGKGSWQVIRYDVINQSKTVLTNATKEEYVFDAPASRACFFVVKRTR